MKSDKLMEIQPGLPPNMKIYFEGTRTELSFPLETGWKFGYEIVLSHVHKSIHQKLIDKIEERLPDRSRVGILYLEYGFDDVGEVRITSYSSLSTLSTVLNCITEAFRE